MKLIPLKLKLKIYNTTTKNVNTFDRKGLGAAVLAGIGLFGTGVLVGNMEECGLM